MVYTYFWGMISHKLFYVHFITGGNKKPHSKWGMNN